MARELQSRTYLWMGAGTLALGIGAALASGSGAAHADSTPSSSPGPATAGHHQAAASPSHSTTSSVKSSSKSSATKRKSSAAHQVAKGPGVVSTAVAVHVAKTETAEKSTAAANPPDLGQEIAAQGQAIANEEKAFGTQVQNFVTTTNFIALPPKGILTEFYYGVSAGTLIEVAQWTNGVARGLNGVAQSITALETGIISIPGGLSFDKALFKTVSPVVTKLAEQAIVVEAASTKFWVTAGAYESGFIQNLPQQYGTTLT